MSDSSESGGLPRKQPEVKETRRPPAQEPPVIAHICQPMGLTLGHQVDVEGGHHSAHFVGKSNSSATSKEQSNRPPSVVPRPN